ncbi:MAG TPA: HDOD domain-containing protein [Telluria sp.]
MSWIGKMFGGEGEAKSAPVAANTSEMEAQEPATAEEIDAVYYRWLSEAGPKAASPETEKLILDELTRIAQSPTEGAALVPRVPAIIPKLMRTLQDEDMNVADLARQLSEDVVLVAEVYREANRPCYRPRYHSGPEISTVDGAIMLLGQSGMRMLLARVAFRPIISMQSGALAKRAAPLIWRQSEKAALAASLLAAPLRANAFEAYLAGLMSNVGLVVAFRLIDQMAPEDALPQSDEFIAGLFAQARILSARIAGLWEFPTTVMVAIETAGEPAAPALAQALAQGDRVSKLRVLVDATQFLRDDPFVVAGLGKAALASFDKLEDADE